MKNMQLRIPGPTPCPPAVLAAISRQMIDHRGEEFKDILLRVTANLKRVFQTDNDLLVLTSSGTGGLEASIVNTLSPGDKVLSISVGMFGERFRDIARAYGATIIPLDFEYGTGADPEVVRKALKDNPDIKAVILTHNETSTGVANDVAALAKVINEFDKLILVDSVSGMGSLDLPVDKLGLDVVVAASQKGWMVPPGLAMVSISKRAWKANATARMPRYYLDFVKARTLLAEGETPWTPALPVFYGFDIALDIILKEGIQNVYARQQKLAGFVRKEVMARGFELFPDEKYISNVMTVFKAGDIQVPRLRQILRDEYGVVIAGGQGKLKDKILRVAHLGYVNEDDMKEVLKALDKAIPGARAK
jgi:aspartate aminotransferase-like enzyme